MNSNSNMTTSGQLKLTQNEIDYLQQFLKANDRGGYYLAFASFHPLRSTLLRWNAKQVYIV
jgi:hypothetical protein